MIESIVLALIVGAIIGLVARLVMPGEQNISMLATVLIGALGGLIGSVVASQFGYHNANGGVAWIPFFIGIVAAITLMGRRGGTGIMGRRGGTGIMGRVPVSGCLGRSLGRKARVLREPGEEFIRNPRVKQRI